MWGAWAWSSRLRIDPFHHPPLLKRGRLSSDLRQAVRLPPGRGLPITPSPSLYALRPALLLFQGLMSTQGAHLQDFSWERRKLWGFSPGLKTAPASSFSLTRERGRPPVFAIPRAVLEWISSSRRATSRARLLWLCPSLLLLVWGVFFPWNLSSVSTVSLCFPIF